MAAAAKLVARRKGEDHYSCTSKSRRMGRTLRRMQNKATQLGLKWLAWQRWRQGGAAACSNNPSAMVGAGSGGCANAGAGTKARTLARPKQAQQVSPPGTEKAGADSASMQRQAMSMATVAPGRRCKQPHRNGRCGFRRQSQWLRQARRRHRGPHLGHRRAGSPTTGCASWRSVRRDDGE